MKSTVTIILLMLMLLVLMAACGPVASFLRGAADGIDGIDTRPDDDPARSEPLSNTAYVGGGLLALVLAGVFGSKYAVKKRK